jgi:aryl-alcohol dehydrogenase-like predicted oxidoreductase
LTVKRPSARGRDRDEIRRDAPAGRRQRRQRQPGLFAQACEASPKRLGVQVIDIYYQHRVDPAVAVEETVGAMARLVEQGKVRLLGCARRGPNGSPATLHLT